MDTPNAPQGDPDELAIQRYRYLLRTAPPEALEAAHEEAFARLTPEQRRRVLEGLADQVDPAELRYADESPQGLARLATRAELRHPGTMERAFGGERGAGGWGGLGGGFAGSFFGMLAGAFIGTSIASALFPVDVSASGDAPVGDPSGGDAQGEGGWSDSGAGGDDGGRVQGGEWGDPGDGGDAGGWDGGDAGGWDGGDPGGFGDGGGFDGGGFDLGF